MSKEATYISIPSPSSRLGGCLYDVSDATEVLIIASATGVKQEFYSKFAHFIQSHGIAVLTFDYYGIGHSLTQPIRNIKINAEAWAKNDLQSVIEYTVDRFPNARKLLLGHSIGGQLIGLTPAATQIDTILLVAAQSGYWRYWSGRGRAEMWFNWFVLFPTLLPTFGYLPSKKITGMENLPRTMAQQWRNWGTYKNYYLDDPTLGTTYFEDIQARVTAFSIEDDKFAPKAAVQWLTSQFKNSDVESLHLEAKEFNSKQIGHFGIFKDRFEDSIWPLLLTHLRKG